MSVLQARAASERPDVGARPVQTRRSVARAEVTKLLAPGGVRGWVIVSLALGLIVGIGTVLLTLVDDVQEVLGLSVADSMSTGPLMALVPLTIAAANYVAREVGDGTVVTAKHLVPRYETLFVGRLLGWAVLSFVVMAVNAVAVLAVALIVPSVDRSEILTTVASLLLVTLVPTVTVALVHAGAIVLRRGAYIVSVGIAVLIVIPLVAAIGQLTLTGPAATVANGVSTAMLGPIVLKAMSVPGAQDGSWAATGGSLLGLLAWFSAVAGLAFWSFRRPGYGE